MSLKTRVNAGLDALRRRAGLRTSIVALISLIIHCFFALLLVYGDFSAPQKTTKTVAVTIPSGAFARNRQVLTPEQKQKRAEMKRQLDEKRQEQEEKKIEKEKKLTGQVVDLPASPDNHAPEDAKYLSEFNTNTKKETKSRNRQMDYKRATNEVTGLVQQPNPTLGEAKAITQKDEQAQKAKKQKTQQDAALEIPRLDARDRLALSIDNSLGIMRNQLSTEKSEGNSSRFKMTPGENGQAAQEEHDASEAQQPKSIKDLMPSIGVLSRIAGAPANDFLAEDVPDGEGTFLNSHEFKFAPFFNRLKQSVSQHWKPLNEFQRRDPSGNIYGHQSRVTVVSVQLNNKGELTSIDVVKSSGVDFLDTEAVGAFQRAQPFPNVPKQLVKDGQTEFKFAFHIDFGRNGFEF